MFRKIVLLGLLASFMSTPALAEGTSKEEGAGMGAGVVIGAIVGGPVGAIIGAALGAKIGDEFHQRNDEVDSLTASLDGSTNRVFTLERDIVALNSELRESQQLAKPELLALLRTGIEFDLLFRTDEDVLTGTTGVKLRQLAKSLAGNPDIQIRLDGFADERGDAVYNQELSVRRAEYVRNLLVSSGIPSARISTNAHGESPAVDTNIDSYALERRVSLVLYMGETPSFAANPR
jgi:outer membrane protein OmpA-like peptidoglycan-associated protein